MFSFVMVVLVLYVICMFMFAVDDDLMLDEYSDIIEHIELH